MHNHSNDNYINFENRVNDPGLALDVKVGLGPFWTLVQVLLYNDVVHVSFSSSVSSFQHTRTTTVREIYTRMQMKDLINDFNLFNHNNK
jgi:hypothetical protein